MYQFFIHIESPLDKYVHIYKLKNKVTPPKNDMHQNHTLYTVHIYTKKYETMN